MTDVVFISALAFGVALLGTLLCIAHIASRRLAAHRAERRALADGQGEPPLPFEFAPPEGATDAFWLRTILGIGRRNRNRRAGEVTTTVPIESSASYAPRSFAAVDKN